LPFLLFITASSFARFGWHAAGHMSDRILAAQQIGGGCSARSRSSAAPSLRLLSLVSVHRFPEHHPETEQGLTSALVTSGSVFLLAAQWTMFLFPTYRP
jgi:hypothetical protein